MAHLGDVKGHGDAASGGELEAEALVGMAMEEVFEFVELHGGSGFGFAVAGG
jgi:hypothetical protein